jgi:hypothetical protein
MYEGMLMRTLMPLRKVVTEVTNEADPDDQSGIRRAIRAWHNRLANGSVPRQLVAKIGRQLFLDLDAFNDWIEGQNKQEAPPRRGRPRST